ncbi:MAG: NAD(+)/NADH kinase [Deltaproteobacteria bacterium]|nr:NAD(+)/NADH kinase [Deltaproteobacteria bacterium]
MNKIGIVVKADKKAGKKADELEKWLLARGVEIIRQASQPPGRQHFGESVSFAPSDLSCIFVLGGDGTFLSAVRWIGDQDIPILGVKFGEVGFLAETVEENLFSVAESILKNDFTTKPRMRLTVKVLQSERKIAEETVLNDVVINKGALARLANIKTYIDDHYLTTFRADGLIVSTPTGSTAYSLAAGGPVIHPLVPGIVMTPICPFTLTNRPLIIPDSAKVTIRLEEKSSDIMLTFDGQEGLKIDEQNAVVIQKSPRPIRMVTIPELHFFDVLKEKLRWSGGRV